MSDRPSADIDLFMDWQQRADFSAGVDLVVDALSQNGYVFAIVSRNDTFARLQLNETTNAAEPLKLELSAPTRHVDHRPSPPSRRRGRQ